MNKYRSHKLKSFRNIAHFLRQYWLVALCIAAVGAALWLGAPAWAAPVSQIGGTVPRPTPTSEIGPIATATPQPDDGDDTGGGEGGDTGGEEGVDPNNPNITFPQNPEGSDPATGPAAPGGVGAAPASNLTAVVTVNGLNLRDGPGTSFNTLGNLPANTQVTVLARSEDGAWWYICCLPGTETRGWASAQLLTPNFDTAQANELIPLFGVTPGAAATSAAPNGTQATGQSAGPLAVDFQIEPYFVWQGITATLTITVNNPNTVDAVDVLLSDELPAELTLVEATADAGGTVETITTANNRPLLLFRWANIPADTAATATIVVVVADDLANGAVIDNLVATRARNTAYSASAVTIGMPPVVPPDFQ